MSVCHPLQTVSLQRCFATSIRTRSARKGMIREGFLAIVQLQRQATKAKFWLGLRGPTILTIQQTKKCPHVDLEFKNKRIRKDCFEIR
jgi:hypothetical protein